MNTQCTTGGGRTGPSNAVGDGTGDDVVVVAGGGVKLHVLLVDLAQAPLQL